MTGAVLLFVVPAGAERGEDTTFLMDWSTAAGLPWDVLLLFGGGVSLAEAISDSGLAAWLGQALGGPVARWPLLATILVLTAMVLLLTELASNTAGRGWPTGHAGRSLLIGLTAASYSYLVRFL